MSNTLIEQRLVCCLCRFCFVVPIRPAEEWRVDAQCPSCEFSACFTVADTLERQPPLPDPKERDREVQQLGEHLWQPINAHRNHPTVAWLDRVGNGFFKDDKSECCWPVPWWVYRFTRERQAAYFWQEEDSWFVRGWHPLRGRGKPPEPAEVFTFESALDRLLG